MNTLSTVQKITKVLHVLAKIGKIFTFIGFFAGLISGVILIGIKHNLLKLELLMSYVPNVDLNELSIQAFTSAIVCLGEAIVAVYTVRYLENELKDGTPFTARGAKELMYLGIRTIAYPLGAIIIASIICSAADVAQDYDNMVEVGTGIIMILLSFVFRYGAELEEKCKKLEQDNPTQT